MDAFVYTSSPVRVVFGTDTLAQVATEVGSGKRAFLLAGGHLRAGPAAQLAALLGPALAGMSFAAVMHTPVDVTERVLTEVQAADADIIIALGGGSTIGLAKAIALRSDLPIIAVPTTYAGSEATSILGQTENGIKTTLRDDRLRPRSIIYDVALTVGMSATQSAASGLNAMAHAVEAVYARDANPVTSSFALQGLAALARALPRIAADPGDIDARSDALFGAWACGTCLDTVGMALHHKLCHMLGGSFGLPHAETHAVILPHVAAFNASAAPEALARVAAAIGTRDAGEGLYDLAATLGLPTRLADIGLAAGDLDRGAEIATAVPYWNPRPVDRAAIRSLLDDAFHGRRPVSKESVER